MNNDIKIAKSLLKLAKQLIADDEYIFNVKQLQKQLKKIIIKEYDHFKMIHKDEQWIASPKNENADLPKVYVRIKDNKIVTGYFYSDEDIDEDNNYQGSKQETITGILEQIAILKKKIEEIIVNLKNQTMEKKIQQNKGDGENNEDSGDDVSDQSDALSQDEDSEQ